MSAKSKVLLLGLAAVTAVQSVVEHLAKLECIWDDILPVLDRENPNYILLGNRSIKRRYHTAVINMRREKDSVGIIGEITF